jgi:hypothetical protein
MTRDAFPVPLRIELVVKPVSELRLVFAAHNRFIGLDDHGRVADRTPWFMKSAAQQGEAIGGDAPFIGADWARVTVEFGDLRHIWREDAAGVRSRIGIAAQRSEITIRELRVEPLA